MKSIHSIEQRCLQQLLRTIRQEARLTQGALADKLGLPQSFVSKYESGERLLDLLEVRHICSALQVDLATFVKRLEREISRAS